MRVPADTALAGTFMHQPMVKTQVAMRAMRLPGVELSGVRPWRIRSYVRPTQSAKKSAWAHINVQMAGRMNEVGGVDMVDSQFIWKD